MKHSRSAIRGAIALDILNTNRASLPRPGRPIIYTDRDKRFMLRNLRLFPKLTFSQRRDHTGLKMSNATIKRIADNAGIKYWKAKRRPVFSKKVAEERLLWCKIRAHWGVEEWRKYIWSDECSVERGRGKVVEWVFGYPKDKWKPKMVQPIQRESRYG